MSGDRNIVGAAPLLPWPLCAWPWWNKPVRAERLASLRIVLGLVLLADIVLTYLPGLDDFFSAAGASEPSAYAWYGRSPRAYWTLLRGLGDPLVSALAAALWIALSAWAFLDAWGRSRERVPRPLGFGFYVLWTLAGFLTTAGVWGRTLADPEPRMAWLIAAGVAAWVQLLHLPFLALQNLRAGRSFDWLSPLTCVLISASAIGIGWAAGRQERPFVAPLLESWQTHPAMMRAAIGTWIVATALWTIGLGSRWTNVVVWAMAQSFANVNPYVENAGDSIRNAVLFVLMFAPTGAAWSVDALLLRSRRHAAEGARQPASPAYVHPWPLRLIFLQMVCIYFFNGLYKFGGETWKDGTSLHYALCDVTLTRFSFARLNLPLEWTRLATWTVLAWELAFPALALFRWTRVPALAFGALFHLGIGLTMEIGSFVPVMLALYVPLLPWDRWLTRRTSDPIRAR